MSAKAVQISVDRALLARIDRDPQTKKQGRSAFIRDAVELYLEAKRRRETDARIRTAFAGHDSEILSEVESMLGGQAWPER
ncbi:MAG: ribbon-helix-helix protein, CopG family [Polyangiaceae bacterium]|nr:ribbon-helix-helix protein, CopG family [Myxococcales bacterium]MCC6903165.1 ribbon-helix-helix protein, CopG family [Polyangiaceae bacterium]